MIALDSGARRIIMLVHVCECVSFVDLQKRCNVLINEMPKDVSNSILNLKLLVLMSASIEQTNSAYVTGFGKTLRMGFFLKIEFDARLISSTIELTRVQVLG